MRDETEEVPMGRDNEQWKLCEIMYVTCFKRNNASQMTALKHETHKKKFNHETLHNKHCLFEKVPDIARSCHTSAWQPLEHAVEYCRHITPRIYTLKILQIEKFSPGHHGRTQIRQKSFVEFASLVTT